MANQIPAEPVRFTKSSRGKNQAIHEGFLYTFDKKSKRDPNLKFWVCANYTRNDENSCPARLHTRLEQAVKVERDRHNHDEDPALIAAKEIRNQMKDRARGTVELPTQIKDNILREQGVSQAVVAKLGTDKNLRTMVELVRTRRDAPPPDPQNLIQLIIPDKYKVYGENAERFLLFDSGSLVPDPHRILIFGRASISDWIDRVENFFIDGTFKIVPHLFGQLIMILGKRNGQAFPLFYCLLPNKTRNTYERLFAKIAELFPALEPYSVALDFELALFESVRATWPGAQLHGCFYHLNHSMKQKIKERNLYGRYKNDPDFKLHAKMIVALAFVPLANLENAFDLFREATVGQFEPLNVILDWFEQYYMGMLNRNGTRRTALFPREMWSVHERVLNNEDRTNNFCEAGHRRIQKSLSMEHPNLWKFIEGIKTVQRGRDKAYEEMIAGLPPQKKRRIFVQTDARILQIVQGGFEARTPLEYLRGIAHNFNMDN